MTNIHTIHDRHLRGHSKIGWLDSWHTFSFSGFHDLNRIARGSATLNGESLQAGDGVQINSPELLEIATESNSEILLLDLS